MIIDILVGIPVFLFMAWMIYMIRYDPGELKDKRERAIEKQLHYHQEGGICGRFENDKAKTSRKQ